MSKPTLLELVKQDYLLSMTYLQSLQKQPSLAKSICSPEQLNTVFGQTTHRYLFYIESYREAASNYFLFVDNHVYSLLMVEASMIAGVEMLTSLEDYFRRIRSLSRSLAVHISDEPFEAYYPYVEPLPPSIC